MPKVLNNVQVEIVTINFKPNFQVGFIFNKGRNHGINIPVNGTRKQVALNLRLLSDQILTEIENEIKQEASNLPNKVDPIF